MRSNIGFAVCCLLAVVGGCLAQPPSPRFVLDPLPYAYNALEPNIDNETMTLHHTRHHRAAVTGLNTALGQAPAYNGLSLAKILLNVGWLKAPDNVTRAIRNNGGSHFNHATFWLTMRPPTTKTPLNMPDKRLMLAITKSFKDMAGLNASFVEAATRVFGSGWTWLCVAPRPPYSLRIVSTPNQDNPLMAYIVPAADRCIPILGIDLWEHAFYLKHRNVRANYIPLWWGVINWPRVSQNYRYAITGDYDKIWMM